MQHTREIDAVGAVTRLWTVSMSALFLVAVTLTALVFTASASDARSPDGRTYRSAIPISGIQTIGNDGDTAVTAKSRNGIYVVNPVNVGGKLGFQIAQVTKGRKSRTLSKVAAPNLGLFPQFAVGPDWNSPAFDDT